MNRKISSFKNFLERKGLTEIKVLLLFFIILGGILIFAIIANQVEIGGTQKFDDWILTSLRKTNQLGKPIGPGWLQLVMRDITAMGGATVVTLITLIVSIFLLLKKKYFTLLLVILATVGGAILGLVLKEIFARQRPDIAFRLMKENSLSFPSGHSMMSAIVYLSLGALLARMEDERIIKVYIISVAMFLSLIIGLSRIYLGVHYPTDVLAGWVIGTVWASFCWFIVWYIESQRFNNLKQ